ncbi:MAG: YggT family protein [Chloroflexi bacterium]|nr:YggT family protein [Chloroflexota bacterium]MBI4315142.1 YggT family protein [Chloroflexota bacterium]
MANTLVSLISLVSTLFYLLILARIIISWVQVDRYNPVVNMVYQLTEPVLAPIRKVLPAMGTFDFSPLVALLLMEVVARVLTAIVQSSLR